MGEYCRRDQLVLELLDRVGALLSPLPRRGSLAKFIQGSRNARVVLDVLGVKPCHAEERRQFDLVLGDRDRGDAHDLLRVGKATFRVDRVTQNPKFRETDI